MHNFDQVIVPARGGGERTLTAEQFYQIPLEERVALLCDGKVRFLRDGKPLSAIEALRKGRDAKATVGA